jgi:NAD(P)-dependent dehydrogenase (short-subunit alcohol dehydrogenase family)
MAVESFTGKLAVVTGGGSGIGRELVRQLAAQGCSVAACDLNPDTVTVTAATAWAAAPPGVQVTSHACDVSDEAQVQRFRDELLAQHASDHVDLVFSNAGISGGGSFVKDSRQEWERTFAINWWGVYYCARTFLPLLIASGDGVLVNTSSAAGFWATAGSGAPITAYCTSNFAIKGFSEALIEDLRSNAPQVRVVVVMPGVVNTCPVAHRRLAHAVRACDRRGARGAGRGGARVRPRREHRGPGHRGAHRRHRRSRRPVPGRLPAGPDLGRPRGQGPGYQLMTAIRSPSWTTSPSATCILVSTPGPSARTGISIFIDSKITRVSPSLT